MVCWPTLQPLTALSLPPLHRPRTPKEFHSFLKRLDEAREAGKPFNPASLKVNALAVTYPPAKLSVNNYEFQPANPVANKAFKLTISISNEGYTPFQKKGLMQVWLNYTGNGTESCGATGEKQLKLPPLNPGESKDIKITLKAGTTLGRGQVGVLFDSTCLTWNTVGEGLGGAGQRNVL
jgi:hypothetical protein